MQGHFEITVNGTRHQVARMAVDRPFLSWLRDDLGLIGTKAGACAERGCAGACMVCVLDQNGLGESTYRAISGCQITLPMAAGRHFITVEALGSGQDAHRVRRAIADTGAEGCGYCEAGLSMALFELYYRRDVATLEDIHDALAGHTCRCGAPHEVRDAAVALAREAAALRLGSRVSREIERARPRHDPTARIAGDAFDSALAGLAPDSGALSYIDPDGARFYRPRSLLELLRLRNEYAGARFVGAGTGSFRAGSGASSGPQCVLSSEAVVEMRAVFDLGTEWEIGAAVNLSSVREAVRGRCDILDMVLGTFGNRGSRNRATLGGALCALESAGEIGPVLIALGATVVIAGLGHEREMPLEDFLKDAPEESLRGEELVKAVKVPHAGGTGRLCGVARVAPRRRYAPSISNLAVNLELDGERRVLSARVATGASSARPLRAIACEQALVGQPWNGSTVKRAAVALFETVPRSTVTLASAEYRRAVTGALFQKFFYENPAPETPRGHDSARTRGLAGSVLTSLGETAPASEVTTPMAEAEVFEDFDMADQLGEPVGTEEAVGAPGPPSEDDDVDSRDVETPGTEEIQADLPIEVEEFVGPNDSEQNADPGDPVGPEQSDKGLHTKFGLESGIPEPSPGVEEPEEDSLGVIFVDELEKEIEAIEFLESDGADETDEDAAIENIFVDLEDGSGMSEERPQDDSPEEVPFGSIFVDPDGVESSTEANMLPEIEGEMDEEFLFEDEASSGEGDDDPPLEAIFVDHENGEENDNSATVLETESASEVSEMIAQEPVESPEIVPQEQEEATSLAGSGAADEESTAKSETESAAATMKRGALPPPRKVSLEIQPRNGVVIEKEDSPS